MSMTAPTGASVSLGRAPLTNLTMNSSRRLSQFREELEEMELESRRRMIYDLAIAQLESIEAEEVKAAKSSSRKKAKRNAKKAVTTQR